uniref:Uncharacterized protein n=1 Tax=Anguilla anguilla TaxID=7936 RepID=A0A0E9UTQ6_ANGAN
MEAHASTSHQLILLSPTPLLHFSFLPNPIQLMVGMASHIFIL